MIVVVKPPSGASPWQARITVSNPNGPDTVRSLEANGCTALVDAAGFVIAVTLDPPLAEATGSEASPGPAATPRRDGSEPNRGARFEHALGLGLAFVTAAAPEPIPGVTVVWSFAPHPTAAGPSLSPEFRLTAAHARGSGYGGDEGRAAFRLTSASAEFCPYNLRATAWGVRPCALVVGGTVSAQGSDTLEADSHLRPWAVAGASLALHGALGARWRLLLGVGGGTTLIRDRFEFAPVVVHQVPSWSAQATACVAVALP